MPDVFTQVQVHQMNPSTAFIVWDMNPDFEAGSNPTFVVEGSRSGNPDGDDWIVLGTAVNSTGGLFSTTDTVQRTWANSDPWFYRVTITTADGEFASMPVAPEILNLDHEDFQLLKQVFKDTATFMTTAKGGRCGWLFRRKNWGQRSTTYDPDTMSVAVADSAEDYGTGYVGGYWPPFVYCVSSEAGMALGPIRTELDTRTAQYETVRGLAWPIPRREDLWVDRQTGARYFVGSVSILSRVRSIPVQLSVELKQVPPTDVAWKVPLPSSQ